MNVISKVENGEPHTAKGLCEYGGDGAALCVAIDGAPPDDLREIVAIFLRKMVNRARILVMTKVKGRRKLA